MKTHLLMFALLLGCSDYAIHPSEDGSSADPLQYQTTVLDFMCSATCAWENEDACWEELEGHWAFCLDGDEHLDATLASECMALMETARSVDECTWLPEQCMVAEVVISARIGEDTCRGR